MQDDRGSNVAGQEADAGADRERTETSGRELELQAKSLRAREEGQPGAASAEPTREEGDVDRRP